MTEEYMTDEEQLEHVRRLASEYGPWTIGAVVLGMAFVFGWRYYDNHRNERALQAAAQFDQMTSALQHDDRTKARQIADGLIGGYPGSPYADQAKLTLARLYVEDGQDANAVGLLTEIMDKSKDSELKHIARLRLARVLIDQGKPDEALKTLSDAPGAFAANYHDVRGDAFYAKKDFSQASSEYKAALGAAAAGGMDSAVLALKIADLGLPRTPAASVASTSTSTVDSSSKARP
jgi:predicted negative regulator of RcsB-dependent stress response